MTSVEPSTLPVPPAWLKLAPSRLLPRRGVSLAAAVGSRMIALPLFGSRVTSISLVLTIGPLSSSCAPGNIAAVVEMMSPVLHPNTETAAALTSATPAIKRPYSTRAEPLLFLSSLFISVFSFLFGGRNCRRSHSQSLRPHTSSVLIAKFFDTATQHSHKPVPDKT